MKVLIDPRANKELRKLGRQAEAEVRSKLSRLETNPSLGKKLKHSNFWSLRIGDHRAIYEINGAAGTIIVLFAGHRKNVYDNFTKLF